MTRERTSAAPFASSATRSRRAAPMPAGYDVLRNVELPQWFLRDALTAGAIVSAAATILAMLVRGLLGGSWGERFHRRADATIANVREGGLARRRELAEPR